MSGQLVESLKVWLTFGIVTTQLRNVEEVPQSQKTANQWQNFISSLSKRDGTERGDAKELDAHLLELKRTPTSPTRPEDSESSSLLHCSSELSGAYSVATLKEQKGSVECLKYLKSEDITAFGNISGNLILWRNKHTFSTLGNSSTSHQDKVSSIDLTESNLISGSYCIAWWLYRIWFKWYNN